MHDDRDPDDSQAVPQWVWRMLANAELTNALLTLIAENLSALEEVES